MTKNSGMDRLQALSLAQSYCAQAERCRFDVNAMLHRRGLEENLVEDILSSLEKDGFLDQLRYARAFVNDKLRFDHWGRRKISQALWMKHIDGTIVETALSEIDADLYERIAAQLVQSRYRQTKGKDEYERSMKTLRSVVSRGFEVQLVARLLKTDGLPDIGE